MLKAELLKTLRDRSLSVLLIVLLLCAGLFAYLSADTESTVISQMQYEKEISAIIALAQKNLQDLEQTETNPFQIRYEKQVISRYSDLFHVSICNENCRTPSAYLRQTFPQIAYIFAAVLCAIRIFLVEWDTGTYAIIQVTPGGKLKLFFFKFCTLFLFTAFLVLAGDGFTLLGVSLRTGFPDFSVSIQSCDGFQLCPYQINALAAAGIQTCLRIAAAFLFALFSAFFAIVFRSTLLSLASTLVGTGLCIFMSKLPYYGGNSPLLLWNGITLLQGTEWAKRYHSVRFFSLSLPYLPTIICVLALSISVLLFFLCRFASRITSPSPGLDHRIRKQINRIRFRHRPSLHRCHSDLPNRSLLRWELYRILIRQKGVFILAAALLLRGFLLEQQTDLSRGTDTIYREYIHAITGEPSDEKHLQIRKIREELEKSDLDTGEIFQMLDEGTITASEAETMVSAARTVKTRLSALARVESQIAYADRRAEEGIPVRYFYDTGYTALFNPAYNYVLPAALIFLCADIFSRDTQSGFSVLLDTYYKGAKTARRRKYFAAVLISFLYVFADSIVLYFAAAFRYELPCFFSPAASLECFASLTGSASLFDIFLLVTLSRCFFAGLLALLLCLCSSVCGKTLFSFALCSIVSFLPHLLSRFFPIILILDLGSHAGGTLLLNTLLRTEETGSALSFAITIFVNVFLLCLLLLLRRSSRASRMTARQRSGSSTSPRTADSDGAVPS